MSFFTQGARVERAAVAMPTPMACRPKKVKSALASVDRNLGHHAGELVAPQGGREKPDVSDQAQQGGGASLVIVSKPTGPRSISPTVLRK